MDYSKEPFLKEPHHIGASGIDTETTGLDPKKHGIVEIGAIAHNHLGQELGRFHSLVNPGDVEFDPEAMSTHKISMDEIKNAPSYAEVIPKFLDFLAKHHQWKINTYSKGKVWTTPRTHIVGHKLSFDLDMINGAIDKMEASGHPLASVLRKQLSGLTRHQHDTQQHGPVYENQHTLGGAGKQHNIPNEGAHRVMGDITQTLGVYHSQRGKQRQLERLALEEAQRQRDKELSKKSLSEILEKEAAVQLKAMPSDSVNDILKDYVQSNHERMKDNFPNNPYKHIMEKGEFSNPSATPAHIKAGNPQNCYSNAARLVMQNPHNFTYNEGVALHPVSGVPRLHAWVTDKNNNVIDNTWNVPQEHLPNAGYFGVKVPTKEIIRHVVSKGGPYLLKD